MVKKKLKNITLLILIHRGVHWTSWLGGRYGRLDESLTGAAMRRGRGAAGTHWMQGCRNASRIHQLSARVASWRADNQRIPWRWSLHGRQA